MQPELATSIATSSAPSSRDGFPTADHHGTPPFEGSTNNRSYLAYEQTFVPAEIEGSASSSWLDRGAPECDSFLADPIGTPPFEGSTNNRSYLAYEQTFVPAELEGSASSSWLDRGAPECDSFPTADHHGTPPFEGSTNNRSYLAYEQTFVPAEIEGSASSSWLNRSLLQVVAVGALLAPMAAATRIAGALSRNRLETDRAATALAQLGIHERPVAIERLGGGRSNAVYRIRFADRTLVLKQALSEGTLLALAARWVGPQPYGAVSAAARIGREARALEILHAAGVRVPRVIAANIPAGLLLVEHVDGEPLPGTLHRPNAAARIRAYAEAMRAAHAAGIALTDGHPGNALVAADDTVTLIDLEFAETAADLGGRFAARCAFDVAYASQYFHADERRLFLAAVGGLARAREIALAAAPLVAFHLLFGLERRRQRRISAIDATSSIQRAA